MEPKHNQKVICPFNMAHEIEHYRLQIHLRKCMKQYPEVHSIVCPFNTNHVVKRDEIDHHVSTCSNRVMLDTDVYVEGEDHRPPVQVVHLPQNCVPSENWDDEPTGSYKPEEAKKDAPIYKKVKGAAPAERSRFRYENSVRYMAQQSSNSSQDSQHGHY